MCIKLFNLNKQRTILGAREDDGQLRMEADAGHVLGVTLQSLNAGFVLADKDTQQRTHTHKHAHTLIR